MAWLYLLIAVTCEIAWVVGLRFTQGWTRPGPSACVILAYVACLYPLSLAARSMAPSLAYAIWVGAGIVGVSLIDILYFGERLSGPKLVCIALILIGALGLKALEAKT